VLLNKTVPAVATAAANVHAIDAAAAPSLFRAPDPLVAELGRLIR